MDGTFLFYDASKPNVEKYLDYKLAVVPERCHETYLEGFYDGLLGVFKREFRNLKCFSKYGSEDKKWELELTKEVANEEKA